MRKLIMALELTLDGFYAGSHDEFDWFKVDQDLWQKWFQQLGTIDTVLLGRKNYEWFYTCWPAVASNPKASETDVAFSRWLDDISKVVFSKTLDKVEWQNSKLATDVAEEIVSLKQQSGKDILIMHSSSIAQTCMQHDLIDEYWLILHPGAAGKGRALFTGRVKLNLLDSRVFDSGQVYLHYATAPD